MRVPRYKLKLFLYKIDVFTSFIHKIYKAGILGKHVYMGDASSPPSQDARQKYVIHPPDGRGLAGDVEGFHGSAGRDEELTLAVGGVERLRVVLRIHAPVSHDVILCSQNSLFQDMSSNFH